MYLVIPSDKAEEGGAAIIEFIWLHENYIKVKNDLSNSEVGDVGRALQTAPLRINQCTKVTKQPITGNTFRLADLCFRWFNRHGFHVMAGRPRISRRAVREVPVRWCDGSMIVRAPPNTFDATLCPSKSSSGSPRDQEFC